MYVLIEEGDDIMRYLASFFVDIDWISVVVVLLNVIAIVGIGCLLYYMFVRKKRTGAADRAD